MNTSKKIYFLSAFVLIIGCLALNLSYSLFVQTEEKEIVNASVPSLSYNLTIVDGQIVNENNKQYSITIPKGTNKIVKININNIGTADINYGIKLIEEITQYQKVQLVDIEDNDIFGTVEGNKTKEVQLYIEYIDGKTTTPNEDFTFTFELVANYTTLDLGYEIDTKIIRDPKYNKSLNVILMNDTRIKKNTSTPSFTGLETKEVGMYSAPDDYGTSWYFRGKQSYNYVNFAGFTWRIVRINGDESIRLILDGSIDSVKRKNEDGTENNKYAGENLDYFHSTGSDVGYAGYMHGDFTGNSATYDIAHKNEKDSVIKEKVDLFYETYIENEKSGYQYEKYLADTLFCGDKTYASDEFSSNTTGSVKFFSALERLYYSSPGSLLSLANPILECAKGAPNTYSRYTSKTDESTLTVKGVSVNNDLKHPIALLSADEYIMAGGWIGVVANNLTFYLNDSLVNGTLSPYWWTMTPFSGNTETSSVFVVQELAKNIAEYPVRSTTLNDMGIRPVINLKADIQIKSGKGTYESPYTIEEIVE